MDDSMNSVHSTSAMDISPASSPRTALNPISSNHLLLNAFHQQQESLSNILYSAPNKNDYPSISKKQMSGEDDNHSNSLCLFTTVLTDNNNIDSQVQTIPNESNQLRQRIITAESMPSIAEPISTIKTSKSNSSRQSVNKLILLIPILIFIIYFIVQHMNTSSILPRPSNWKNASDYLTKNLVGQDQGLEEFINAMEKHKNFSIVIIEGPTGTGKSYLASSLEKFIPTTLISTNTLLGLSAHHWTESDRLSSYLLSYLSSSLFQILIIDDLDLLPTNKTYCQTLTTSLHSINNNKNLFILLLQTGTISNICKEAFENIITKSIQFNMLQRQHIQTCIQNEAYTQNVQPPIDNQQIEKILNSLEYINEQGILYSTTGCKKIPSLVMLASKRAHTDD